MYDSLKVVMTGNVGKTYAGTSGKMLSVSVASQFQFRVEGSEEPQYASTWLDAKVLGADAFARVNKLDLQPGQSVFVVGTLRSYSKDNRTYVECIADSIQKLDDAPAKGFDTCRVFGVASVGSISLSPKGGVANIGIAHDVAEYIDGKTQYVPSWFTSVARGAKRAERASKFLTGDKLFIEGNLISREVQGRDGKVMITEIVLNHFTRTHENPQGKPALGHTAAASSASNVQAPADIPENDEVMRARQALLEAEKRASQVSGGIAGTTTAAG